jgi:excisionase family DNA binding protein
MEEIKVYSLKEVEQILKVSQRTLYNYIKSGKLKAVKMGKYWRVSHEALKDFTEHGTESRD